ncbi:MAG: mechanosensitive ion channel family protein [Bacteroidota bacterium]
MEINKNIFFLLCFLCLLHTPPLNAQQEIAPSPTFSNPYNTIYVHLYYLQARSYQPEIAALTIQGEEGQEAIRKAIQLKQILDGKGLFVHLNLLPQQNDYVDSLSMKAYYTPFPEALPEVYLEKVDSVWLFSKETVGLISEMHKEIYPFGMDRLLNWLPKTGQQRILGLATWQYLGIAILILLVWVVYHLLSFVFNPLVKRLAKSKYALQEDSPLKMRISYMFSLLILLNLVRMVLPVLQLPIRMVEFSVMGLRIMTTVVAMLLGLRILRLVMNYAGRYAQRTDNRMDEQLLPIVRRLLAIVIVTGAIIQILHLLDVNVTALIAGVSIGGLALALAAQDTVKNLIGSAMIFVDRPFQIGDFIEISGMAGTVVEVGFRSTRIQTGDTSIISIPNGTVANQSVTNKGVRVYRLLRTTLGIRYDTPPEQIKLFIDGLRKLIATHAQTRKEGYYVHFSEFSASSLDIFFWVYLEVSTWGEELAAKEDVLLAVLELANELGVEFAYPSTSIYMEKTAQT